MPIPHRPTPGSPPDILLKNRDGSPHPIAPHAPLPADRARFVGEPVAMVVAETVHAAMDAAERVEVHYEPLPSVASARSAARGGRSSALRRPRQPMHRRRCWRSRRHRGSVRPRGVRRSARDMGPTRDRRADGAALGSCLLRSCERSLLASRRQRRHRPAKAGACHDSSGANRGSARHRERNRRQFRHAQRILPRICIWLHGRRSVSAVRSSGPATRQEAFLSDYQGRDLFVEAELALAADGRFPARYAPRT